MASWPFQGQVVYQASGQKAAVRYFFQSGGPTDARYTSRAFSVIAIGGDEPGCILEVNRIGNASSGIILPVTFTSGMLPTTIEYNGKVIGSISRTWVALRISLVWSRVHEDVVQGEDEVDIFGHNVERSSMPTGIFDKLQLVAGALLWVLDVPMHCNSVVNYMLRDPPDPGFAIVTAFATVFSWLLGARYLSVVSRLNGRSIWQHVQWVWRLRFGRRCPVGVQLWEMPKGSFTIVQAILASLILPYSFIVKRFDWTIPVCIMFATWLNGIKTIVGNKTLMSPVKNTFDFFAEGEPGSQFETFRLYSMGVALASSLATIVAPIAETFTQSTELRWENLVLIAIVNLVVVLVMMPGGARKTKGLRTIFLKRAEVNFGALLCRVLFVPMYMFLNAITVFFWMAIAKQYWLNLLSMSANWTPAKVIAYVAVISNCLCPVLALIQILVAQCANIYPGLSLSKPVQWPQD